MSKTVFSGEFTRQEPIPDAGIQRAMELMQNGRLHRYNTAGDEIAEAALLEADFAHYMGTQYCVALNSCGSAIYVALRSAGVKPGDLVLCNAFTLAPVPGAIENAGGRPVFVEITEDFTVDLQDLDHKSATSGASFFLISHMRGHITDMDAVSAIMEKHHITLIEDCAHTAGCRWGDRLTGTFGQVGCFSTQTYKHMNSGEGGLLVSDVDDIAAQAILYSGSYMLYERHGARPAAQAFEKFKLVTPNFSLRMSNLHAALVRPQLADLNRQCQRWNDRYRVIEAGLTGLQWIRLPVRPDKEQYVGSSFQFTLQGVEEGLVETFLHECEARGVEIKWFGRDKPHGFTSAYDSWQYIPDLPDLPKTKAILAFTCDFRVPLTFSLEDCKVITQVIREVCEDLFVGD